MPQLQSAESTTMQRRPTSSEIIADIPTGERHPAVEQALASLAVELAAVRSDLVACRARIGELERAVETDTLTPVLNRRGFMRALGQVAAFVSRHSATAALIYFDLDGLKAINDAHGHDAGDQCLIHVAVTIAGSLRASDTVARLGGDEFGVILLMPEPGRVDATAERIAQAVATRPLPWNGASIPLAVSWGAHPLGPDDLPLTALAAADRAMYRARAARGG